VRRKEVHGRCGEGRLGVRPEVHVQHELVQRHAVGDTVEKVEDLGGGKPDERDVQGGLVVGVVGSGLPHRFDLDHVVLTACPQSCRYRRVDAVRVLEKLEDLDANHGV